MSDETSNVIVRLEDVTKTYKQGKVEVPAVRGVSLELHRGDLVALAGPSGSGKTTLLNLIGALDVPTAGRLTVAGEDLAALSSRQLANLRLRKLGFVFQAYNLVPVLSAYENAEYVLMLQGVPPAERKKRVMDVLAAVGLDGLAHRRPAELSGGQQQRVAVARAIVANPDLILADEPTANLDSSTGTALLDLMGDLNGRLGITFLFSSHDPKVLHRARRVITLEDGKVVSDERKNGMVAAASAKAT